ncbi:nucleotide sugar dehydrogenase, partial [candidate division KSB1 bacterium]|nr:nucleotide sugar dehydrogenase [candidate division KSB1 bacterium]
MKISVFGLGYVGCVSAACFAEMGHKVVGVDVNENKVNMINKGISPIIEKGLGALIQEQVSVGRLTATKDTTFAGMNSDIMFICVGTPSETNGSINLAYVERVSDEIGRVLKERRDYTVVALRSTVLPGVAEEVVLRRLQSHSGKKVGVDFGFALNPEFLREGTSVYDFYHPPKTVIGVFDARSAEVLQRLYDKIPAPIFLVKPDEASMVKYADNAFHAIKVAFANEIGRLCKIFHVDSRVVMDVFIKDLKLNLSSYYLKPGFAFGGSCLPKDLRALTHRARQVDIAVPLLDAAITSNSEHIRFALNMIKENGRKKIGILGLSFKQGTDDLRESPMVTLVEQLLGKGYDVHIFDKNVSLARLIGANKEYIEREVPHIAKLMCASVQDVLARSEVV